MTRWFWLVVLAATNVVWAGELGGSFNWAGFDVGYSANRDDNDTAYLYGHVGSSAHRIEQAWISIRPDGSSGGDGQAHFVITGRIHGEMEAPLNRDRNYANFLYEAGGIRYHQGNDTYFDEWQQGGVWFQRNTGTISASISNSVWDSVSVNYDEWPNPWPGDPLFNWYFEARGHFLDPVAGREFLASIPEPATLAFLSLGLPFLRRRQ